MEITLPKNVEEKVTAVGSIIGRQGWPALAVAWSLLSTEERDGISTEVLLTFLEHGLLFSEFERNVGEEVLEYLLVEREVEIEKVLDVVNSRCYHCWQEKNERFQRKYIVCVFLITEDIISLEESKKRIFKFGDWVKIYYFLKNYPEVMEIEEEKILAILKKKVDTTPEKRLHLFSITRDEKILRKVQKDIDEIYLPRILKNSPEL